MRHSASRLLAIIATWVPEWRPTPGPSSRPISSTGFQKQCPQNLHHLTGRLDLQNKRKSKRRNAGSLEWCEGHPYSCHHWIVVSPSQALLKAEAKVSQSHSSPSPVTETQTHTQYCLSSVAATTCKQVSACTFLISYLSFVAKMRMPLWGELPSFFFSSSETVWILRV